MTLTTINKVKPDGLFRFKPEGRIYVRNHYDRASKTYSYNPYDNVNDEHFARPTRKVYID